MRHLYLLLLFFSCAAIAQTETPAGFAVEANYFYGNIIPHRKGMMHLILGHPEGMVLSINKKTFGTREWESAYNYPEYGASFHYQDMKNEALGKMYGLYAHYNFFFLQRHLMFRIGQGVAYNTNPYNKGTNYRNYAYRAHIMPSTYFMLNYSKQNLLGPLGVQAGLIFVHHSNASMKSPNTSTNTVGVNVGINYSFGDKQAVADTITPLPPAQFSKALHYNFVVRGGINQSDLIGSKQYPYYAFSGYLSKRISRKSGLEAGADFFIPKYLKEYIHYMYIAYPEIHSNPNADYHKLGLFGGYELYINKMSFEGQVGYYVYEPYKNTGGLYERLSLKYYLSKRFFTGISLKTHGAKAEVMEFNFGIQL